MTSRPSPTLGTEEATITFWGLEQECGMRNSAPAATARRSLLPSCLPLWIARFAEEYLDAKYVAVDL